MRQGKGIKNGDIEIVNRETKAKKQTETDRDRWKYKERERDARQTTHGNSNIQKKAEDTETAAGLQRDRQADCHGHWSVSTDT